MSAEGPGLPCMLLGRPREEEAALADAAAPRFMSARSCVIPGPPGPAATAPSTGASGADEDVRGAVPEKLPCMRSRRSLEKDGVLAATFWYIFASSCVADRKSVV